MWDKEFQSFQRQQQMQEAGTNPLMQGAPMEASMGSEPAGNAGPSFMGLMSGKPVNLKEQFFNQLSGAGIDGKSISQNSLGRKQLEEKLKQLYGDEFAKNPQAASILKSFDAFARGAEAQENDKKLKNKTEMILGYLRGT